jgi:hypothetical protein
MVEDSDLLAIFAKYYKQLNKLKNALQQIFFGVDSRILEQSAKYLQSPNC